MRSPKLSIQFLSILLLLLLPQIIKGYASLLQKQSDSGPDITSQFLPKRALLKTNQTTCHKTLCSLEISTDTINSVILSQGSTQDFILKISNQKDILKISYRSDYLIDASIVIVRPPNTEITSIKTPKKPSWSVDIAGWTIEDFQGYDLVLRMKHTGPTTGAIQMDVTMTFQDGADSEESHTMLIVVVIVGTLTFIISTTAITCYLRIRRNRRRAYESEEVTSEKIRENVISERLSVENLDSHFPQIDFEEIKNNAFAQTTCSICLEELNPGALCRQLYCDHIFHAECVRIWLVNRIEKSQAAVCPICHRDMSEGPKEDDESRTD